MSHARIDAQAGAARAASRVLARVPSAVRMEALLAMADALLDSADSIVTENEADVRAAQAQGQPPRLALTRTRLTELAAMVRELAVLPDPVGRVVQAWRRTNGLDVAQVRAPVGVVLAVVDACPATCLEVLALALKSGNATLLTGGLPAAGTCRLIVHALQAALGEASLPGSAVQLVEDGDSALQHLLALDGLIDLVVPRGDARFERAIARRTRIPVATCGRGVTHIYVDRSADHGMGVDIVLNAKVHHPDASGSVSTVLVHRDIAHGFLVRLGTELQAHGVRVHGDQAACMHVAWASPAEPADFDAGDRRDAIAVAVVDGMEMALEHIDRHGTRGTEAIVCSDYTAAREFSHRVLAAAVVVNASPCFDGIGRLGPWADTAPVFARHHGLASLGLDALTVERFVIQGNGQIRR